MGKSYSCTAGGRDAIEFSAPIFSSSVLSASVIGHLRHVDPTGGPLHADRVRHTCTVLYEVPRTECRTTTGFWCKLSLLQAVSMLRTSKKIPITSPSPDFSCDLHCICGTCLDYVIHHKSPEPTILTRLSRVHPIIISKGIYIYIYISRQNTLEKRTAKRTRPMWLLK